MAFKQMPKVEDRRLVRNRIAAKFKTGEGTHRLNIIKRIFGAWIGQLIPLLKKVDPQHHDKRIRPTTIAGLRIIRLDQTEKRRPRHDLIHLAQEPFALGALLLVLVIKRGKAKLRHPKPPLNQRIQSTMLRELFRCSLGW